MRRRSKRAPNLSEQTGKIGQELPANQPAPLQPNYASAEYPPNPAQASPDRQPEARTGTRATQLPVVGGDQARTPGGVYRLNHLTEAPVDCLDADHGG